MEGVLDATTMEGVLDATKRFLRMPQKAPWEPQKAHWESQEVPCEPQEAPCGGTRGSIDFCASNKIVNVEDPRG